MKDLFDQIYRVVLLETGVKKEEIISRSRKEHVLNARALFIILSKKILQTSYTVIARELLRDHTSILHLFNTRSNTEFINSVLAKYHNDLDPLSKNMSEKIRLRFLGMTPKKKNYNILYKKYNGRCIVCGFDEIVEVHHILSKYLGGSDDIENLILLCPNHHALADRGMIDIKRKLELMHFN